MHWLQFGRGPLASCFLHKVYGVVYAAGYALQNNLQIADERLAVGGKIMLSGHDTWPRAKPHAV
jgi:hypothetical protein